MKLNTCLPTASLIACFLALLSGCDSQPENAATPPRALSANNETGISKIDPANPPPQPSTVAATEKTYDAPLPTISSASNTDGYQEIEWDALVPKDYRPEAILAKYQEQLAELDDSDPKAMQVYGNIQAELDNAPVNDAINGKKVKLPGFIAPLENTNGTVTEFLLVPYFGACIHVPPPPVNQTVMVKPQKGKGIDADKSDLAYWVKGVITTDKESTDIGSAGYRIEQAEIEIFE